MTKADIVNEIAKNTGIDKATVLTTLGSVYGFSKGFFVKKTKTYT